MDVVAALVSVASIAFGIVSLVVLILKLRRRPATAGATDATVELPSADAHRAALARGVRFATRLFAGMAVGFPVVLIGAGLFLSLSNPGLSVVESLAILGGIGAGIALIIGGLGWWQVRALRADLRRGAFLRTTGPVRVTTIRHGSFLDLVDRSFGVTYDVGHAAKHADVWQVDHSPRGHYVFEMRDRGGAVVYRDKHFPAGRDAWPVGVTRVTGDVASDRYTLGGLGLSTRPGLNVMARQTMGKLTRRKLVLGSVALGGLGLLAGCGIAVPGLSAPARPRTIGMFYGLRPNGPYPEVDVLRARLAELGWSGAQEPRIEIRSGDGTPAKLAEVAAELVALPADILVVSSLPPLQAPKSATTTIPVVFTGISNPVELGLIASLREPGGNLTGLTNLNIQLMAKRVELLKEAAPRITRMAVVSDPTNQGNGEKWGPTRTAAAQLGIQVVPVEIRAADDLPRAFAEITSSGADALLLFADPLTFSLVKPVAEFARSTRLPTAYDFPELPAAGGLLSYGVDPVAAFGQVGDYVDKILRGASPATLPVEQATSLKLVLNLKTAEVLGLTLPPSLLAQATDTIQ